jgi:hypothetical protein
MNKGEGAVRVATLLGVLAAVWIGYAAIATVTASARNDQPSVWAEASDTASSGQIPTLTNDVGQPRDRTGSQLSLGLALMGVGVLGLVFGLAAAVGSRRREPGHPLAQAGGGARAGHRRAGTRAG